MTNAREVCEALQLDPGYLVGVLRREVAYRHRRLAVEAKSEYGPELGGFGLQRIAHLLQLIGEFEAEWERSTPDEEKGDGGAKEATSAATAAQLQGSRRPR